jgi:hypothetical protein
MDMQPDPILPLPSWWCNNTPSPFQHTTDMCEYCGHVRDLHTTPPNVECNAKSFFGQNQACICTGEHTWVRAEISGDFR